MKYFLKQSIHFYRSMVSFIYCVFRTGLIDDYDALISTASKITEFVKPLTDHLCKFNLSWECFIKKLYQIYVYDDPLVQNNLPSFVEQVDQRFINNQKPFDRRWNKNV